MKATNFREWLEGEEGGDGYTAWADGARERLSKVARPSEALRDFVAKYAKGVRACSATMAPSPGSFKRLCLRSREEQFLGQMARGSFGKDLSRPAGTWADGMNPAELGIAYFVLFGKKMPRPHWVDSHQGTNYAPEKPARRGT